MVGFAEGAGRQALTEAQAAAALGVTDRQVRRLIAAGTLDRAGAGRITLASVEKRLGRALDAKTDIQQADMVWVPAAYLEHLAARAVGAETLQIEHKATADQVAALVADLDAERTRAEEDRKTITDTSELLAKERARAAELAAELEAERSRGFFSRLFKR